MAVKARDSITLFHQTDISSVTWYYLLQSSTTTPPTKPTTDPPPSGWTTSEPTYTEGSTNSLYVVEKTVFSDGTFAYSDVSLSTSYEAAKAAYNKAVQSAQTATRYITDITDGIMVHPEGDDTSAPTGWKITDVIEMLKNGVSYFWAGLVNSVATLRLGPSNSGHVMIDDDSVSIMDGDAERASFSQNGLAVEVPDGHLTAGTGLVISQNGSEKGRIWGSSSYGDWMVMEGTQSVVLYGLQGAGIFAPRVGIANYAPASTGIDPEDCEVEISGTLTALNIGVYKSATSSNAITTTGIDTAYVAGARVTLEAGVWVVTGQWPFNTGSSSGTRNLSVQLAPNSSASGSGGYKMVRVTAANQAWASLEVTDIISLSSATTVYIKASSSMTYTTATTNSIRAVRIK